METNSLPVCTTCGLEITDHQDIEYELDSDGNTSNVRHSDEFHRELDA